MPRLSPMLTGDTSNFLAWRAGMIPSQATSTISHLAFIWAQTASIRSTGTEAGLDAGSCLCLPIDEAAEQHVVLHRGSRDVLAAVVKLDGALQIVGQVLGETAARGEDS